ncbi:uncharacterized protein [Typha latifolia]|uniref:uncharacterized protein n=1 Tax=Typha latifolia TaxID=4733 RepID=UPI003C2F0175
MDATFNSPPSPPQKGRTENNSATFLSSGNPCVDFFFQVVPYTPSSTVVDLLDAAWRHRPLTALKLVCHLRGVRGTGKSDREGFYSSALWLHQHHPKTLALNLSSFAQFGYMKDLLEVLYRLLHGGNARKSEKHLRSKSSSSGSKLLCRQSGSKSSKETDKSISPIFQQKCSISRSQKRLDLAASAVERYATDQDYQFLYDRVADFFASLLTSDLKQLRAGHTNKIGLAAKWCPSLDSSFDRHTLLCEAIARRVFPRETDPDYADIAEEHYAYRVRDRLRREVLVPLRKVLELPEVYMSARQWDALPYNRVASVAMKRYKNLFTKHDEERFHDYLEKVKKGKAKIAAGALLPHEILAAAYRGEDDVVAELQWQRLIADVSGKCKLSNCIAVCDVSGSMTGTPMEVCVALGMLISELSEEPWKGRVITFSEKPEIHLIEGNSIAEKMSFVKTMHWGMNTNFQAVFDRILSVAVTGKVPAEKMIRKVFVFSDMEFDEASANDWETDYEAICRKFAASGYGESVPQIVFWNLRDSRSTPVVATQKGVALVSGFAKNLVKLFLNADGVIDPETVMEAAIAGEEYEKLVVVD